MKNQGDKIAFLLLLMAVLGTVIFLCRPIADTSTAAIVSEPLEESKSDDSPNTESNELTPEEKISSLVVLPTREDYLSDESFANFRPIVMGDIAAGTLYRCSAPLAGALPGGSDRARFVDAFLRKGEVQSVMNMAYTEEELKELLSDETYDDSYYKLLYDSGGVFTVNLPYNRTEESFIEGLVGGLTFLSEHEPPFAIHCAGGKDRTGFAAIILEMLMGAAPDDIIADYMQTYINLYGIEPGTVEYDLLAERNVINTLYSLTGAANLETLKQIDMHEKAEDYLLSCGMEREALNRLVTHLHTGQ